MLGLSAGARAKPDIPGTVGVATLEGERLSGPLFASGVEGHSILDSVTVIVTVDRDGRVIAAEPGEHSMRNLPPPLVWRGAEPPPGPAIAAARQWRFRPQQFEGHPVQAIGAIRIGYPVPEQPVDEQAVFPEGSPADTEITLERTSCFVGCPMYTVTVNGEGRVRFSADPATSHVALPGVHDAQISPQAATELIDAFRDHHFAGLQPMYRADLSDTATIILTLKRGGRTIRVTDLTGGFVTTPKALRTLQSEVDRVTDTDRWTYGNAQTIAAMKAQGMDFASAEIAEIAASVIRRHSFDAPLERQRDVGAFLRGLVEQGAALEMPVNGRTGETIPPKLPLGRLIAHFSTMTGDEALFSEMNRRGYVARMTAEERDSAFAAGAGCNVAVARGLLSAGADPQAQGEWGNAWHALGARSGFCEDVEARMDAFVDVMIAARVSPGAVNEAGDMPLHSLRSLALARGLIRAGARLDAQAGDGATALLSTDDDRIALTLLRAGADPHAGAGVGALRARAVEYHWPATLAWLDAKGL
ncbi:DUF6438 domain-containing protein [Croceibacterium xixiisoli]|nr:DUF6438 domain-containing protein [Croceibacterium xixiisoli]